MKIFVFSDFQGEKIIPDGNPDLVILLGDIYWRDALEIDKAYDCEKIGVYGNHDGKTEWDSTNIKIIHGETFEFEGKTFAGFGGSPRYNRKDNQYTEEECYDVMSKLGKVDVFIAHSNPVYDEDGPLSLIDAHRGFLSFNFYIKNKQPDYFLHGHLHDPFERTVGSTIIKSVYPFLELNI